MELIIAGKILGTHHLKGEVKVSSEFENFLDLIGERVVIEDKYANQKVLTIKNITHFVGNKWSLKFEKINNKQDAELLRNSVIKVRRELLGIAEDEILISEMIGMSIFDIENNINIGTLTEIFETAAHDIFVVDSEEYEGMIPDVPEFIKEIDYEKRIIFVKLIDGLIEKKNLK